MKILHMTWVLGSAMWLLERKKYQDPSWTYSLLPQSIPHKCPWKDGMNVCLGGWANEKLKESYALLFGQSSMLYWSSSSFWPQLVFCSSSSSSSSGCSKKTCINYEQSGWNLHLTKWLCVHVIKSSSLSGGICWLFLDLIPSKRKSYPGIAVIPHQPMMRCLQRSKADQDCVRVKSATICLKIATQCSTKCSTNKQTLPKKAASKICWTSIVNSFPLNSIYRLFLNKSCFYTSRASRQFVFNFWLESQHILPGTWESISSTGDILPQPQTPHLLFLFQDRRISRHLLTISWCTYYHHSLKPSSPQPFLGFVFH